MRRINVLPNMMKEPLKVVLRGYTTRDGYATPKRLINELFELGYNCDSFLERMENTLYIWALMDTVERSKRDVLGYRLKV